MRVRQTILLATLCVPLFTAVAGVCSESVKKVVSHMAPADDFSGHGEYISPFWASKIYDYIPGAPPIWENPEVPFIVYTQPHSPGSRADALIQENENAGIAVRDHEEFNRKDVATQKRIKLQEAADDRRIIAVENQRIEAGENPEVVVAQQLAQNPNDDKEEDEAASLTPDSIGQADNGEERRDFENLFGVQATPPQDSVDDDTDDDSQSSDDKPAPVAHSAHIMSTDAQGNPISVPIPATHN